MKSLFKALIVFAWLLLIGVAAAQTSPTRQDQITLRRDVEQFLRTQTAGLPGEVNISVHAIDSRMNLAACSALEPFLPSGSRVWGKTTVGVRCRAPSQWTIYVNAQVQVFADYVVTAAPLPQGKQIGPNDLAQVRGDLTSLPPGIITTPSEAIGKTVAASLAAGTPLRMDSLRNQQAVLQGQVIRLMSNGPGFRITAEARALNNANEGQIVQVKTASGQVVSGVAKPGGVVEVAY